MQLPDDPRLAQSLLDAIEKKARDESFLRYWEPFPYQQKVFEKFTDDIKILVIAGGNRCLSGLTQVAVPGGFKNIQDLVPGDLVYALDGALVPVLKVYKNGPKKLWRWYGKRRNLELSLDATEEHRAVLASEKDNTPTLRELHSLKDRHYFVRHDGVEFGKQEYPLALLIGLLLGDGYIAGNGVQWTCAESELVELLRPYIESFGYVVHSQGIQHYISDPLAAIELKRDSTTGRILEGTKLRHRLRVELQRLGLLGTKSDTKLIPSEVWNWRKEDVAQLLAGLIVTDGSVFQSNGCWHLTYTSKSMELIEGFRKLLADGFGIYGSTISKGSKGTWNVSYGTVQAFSRLADSIPVPGRKGLLIRTAGFVKRNSKAALVPFVDKEFLGEQETYDILIDHPSHVFNLYNNLQVSNSGKTETGAAFTTAYAEGKDYFQGFPAWSWVQGLSIPSKPQKNIWIVGLDYKVLHNVIWREKLVHGANHPGFLPKDSSVSNIREADKQIFFSNGTVVTGMSADSGREKFQSASVDLIWIDEECDAEIFDECYQRTVDCGGRIIVTVTPLIDIASGVKTPWIYNLWEDMRNGRKDIAFVNLSVLDNPVVPEGEKQKLLEKWKGHPEERARLYGEFVRRSGLVYPMWNRAVHVKRTNPPPDWYTVVSIDPAPTGITAALWGRVDPSGNIHLYKEYYRANLPVGEHVQNIKIRNAGDKVDVWLIDRQWGAARTAEAHKTGQQLYRDAGGPGNGLPVRLAEPGDDYGLLAAQEYLQATAAGPESRHPKVWVDPSLTNFIDEIEHYVWDYYRGGPLKGLSKERPSKRQDHAMNSFQYMAAMHPRGKMRLEPNTSEDDLRRLASTNSYF